MFDTLPMTSHRAMSTAEMARMAASLFSVRALTWESRSQTRSMAKGSSPTASSLQAPTTSWRISRKGIDMPLAELQA